MILGSTSGRKDLPRRRGRNHRCRSRSRRATRRPRIEQLEDRRLLAVFSVTTLADEDFGGPGSTSASEAADGTGLSLREAIGLANANGASAGQGEIDGDSIVFDSALAGGTITLTLGDLFIGDDLAIDGSAGSATERITIDADDATRIMRIDTANAPGSLSEVSLSNLVLVRGEATDGPGGAILFFGPTLGLDNVEMSQHRALNGGALHADGAVTINNSTVAGNFSRGSGGGIYLSSGSLLLTGSSVSSNVTSFSGGGIWNNVGSVTITDSTIDGNTANGDGIGQGGGGIFTSGGTLIIDGSSTTVSGNLAAGLNGSGGGILNARGGTISIFDATLDGNTAAEGGGGLSAAGIIGDVLLSGANITNNVASSAGGGARINGPNATITSSNFSGNQAAGTRGQDIGNGGGLLLGGPNAAGLFTVTDSIFEMNTARGGGGGLYILNVNGTVTGGRASGNQVTGSGTGFDTGGGAITVTGTRRTNNVELSSILIDGNSAPSAGGIGIVDAVVTVDSSIVSNNTATDVFGGAGGIGVRGTALPVANLLTVTGSTVLSNLTAGEAGGIGVIDSDALIIDTTIEGNRSTGGDGGGVGVLNLAIAGTARISSSTIHGNTASADGGGIASFNSGLVLENVTISGNVSGTVGGGIANDNNFDNVENSISFSTITANSATSAGANLNAVGFPIDVTGTIFNAGDVSGVPLNSLGGNIDSGSSTGFTLPADFPNTDPLLGPLADNGGLVFTHALLAGSPALDAVPSTGPIADARGVLRPQDSDGDGNALWDIGAFESEQPVALIVDEVIVDEDAGTATVAVLLPTAITGGFTVDFTTADGTATEPDDYTATSGTLTFTGTANETQTITIPVVDDDVVESTETILVSLLNASAASVIATDTGEVAIVDNDTSVLTVDDVIVDEAVGTATVLVTSSHQVQGGFTVEVETLDGTATAPDDYTAARDLLTFTGTVGESQAFTVTIDDDGIVESTETIGIALLNASLAAIDTSDTAAINVTDNDTARLTVDDVTVDEAVGTATVTVTVDNAVQGGFTVDFATADGTALEPGDYSSTSGTLVFDGLAGASETFTVAINDDLVVEFAETINLGLSNPSVAAIDVTDTAVINITDNDTAVLTVDDVTVDEGAGTATVTVSIDNAVEGGFTVEFATSDGTAVAPDDYTAAIGTLTFAGAAGEIETFTVPISDDAIVESIETINVALSDSSVAAVDATDTAIISVADNDMATLTVDDIVVDEAAGTATVTVTVDHAVQGGFTVDFATADGTAVSPDDYAATSGTLTFAGAVGESETFTITINDDAIVESVETISIALSNSSVAAVDATDTAAVSVTDDDSAILTVDDVTVDEAAGTATVTVSVDNAVQGGFTVDFSTTDGTAVAPGDYTSAGGTLTFAGTIGESETFTVSINDDAVVESIEALNVALSNSSRGAVDASDTAVIRITDNDTAILTIDDVTVDEAAGTATVTVTVDSAVQGGFTVDFAASDGTAVAPGDYAAASGTLTFAGTVGESETFTVSVVDDAVVESTETINITLSASSVAAIDATDTATISVTDNDAAVLTVDDVTVDEAAGTATVTVTVDNAVQGGFTVDVATSDGTAVAPGDYAAASGTLTFAGTVGESETFTVSVVDDAVVESTETISVTLSNSSVAAIDATDTATINVTDNDTATLTVDDLTVDEAAGTATVTVTVDNAVQGGFTVDFAASDGTAVAPEDYAAASGALAFAGTAGESETFTVSIVDDAVVESAETIVVTLANASVAAIDATDTATLSVSDNDTAILTVDDVTVDEAAGTATVTVTVDNAVQGGFTVDFVASDGTAVAPDDYAAAGGTLAFAGTVGESETFTVSIVDDVVVESAETIGVTLANSSVAAVDVTDTATINVTDNDTATLTVDDVTVDEAAGTATVTVTVDNAVQGGFTVDFVASDGTAVAPDDYAAAGGTLGFAGTVGESETFTVSIVDDAVVESIETIGVTLSNSSVAAVDATDTATINVIDNDTATLTVDDVTVDEAAGTATITVTVDNAVQGGFTVDLATADGTAAAPDDYASATGTITFAGNVGESQTFAVSINDDAVVESSETININLSKSSAAAVDASDTAAINVTDNDTATLTVDDVTVDEAAGGAFVTVSVDNAVQGGFTVDFSTIDGTAVSPLDYRATAGTLSFSGAIGESQVFSVPIVRDITVEPSESLTVALANPSVASIDSADTGTITITDDDIAILTIEDVVVDESSGTATGFGDATIDVFGPLLLNLPIVGGGGIVDGSVLVLTDSGDNDVVFEFNLAGTNSTFSGAIPVTFSTFDSVAVISETLISEINAALLGLNARQSGIVGSISLGRIEESRVDIDGIPDPADPTLTIPGLTGATLRRGVPADGETVTLSDGTLELTFEFEDSTNSPGTQTGHESVPFNLGGSIGDVAVSLANAINASSLSVVAVAELNDNNDPTGRVSLSEQPLLGIEAGLAPSLQVHSPGIELVITLSGVVPDGFTVDLATGDITATQASDYVATATTVRFTGDDQERRTVTIPVIDDAVVEAIETLEVALSNPSNVAVDVSDTATVSITDNDTATLSLSDLTVDEESGDVVVTATLDNAVQGGFTVDFATADGSAVSPDDFTATSGTLTFSGSAGEQQTVTISIVADQIADPNEQFSIALSNLLTQGNNPADPAAIDITDTATIVIEEPVVATVDGSIYCDLDADNTLDPGEEILGASVALDLNGNGRIDAGEPLTATDSGGYFQIVHSSEGSFQVLVTVPNNASCNTITSEPALLQDPILVGNLAKSIVTADIDNDADLDLLVASDLSNSLTVVENTANGFVRGADINLGDRPQAVFAYESGSGASRRWTVAVAGVGTPTDGGAVYSIADDINSPTRLAGTGGPVDVIVDDFDGDGTHDILSASIRESLLEMRLGNTSEIQTVDSLTSQILSMASGNLNNNPANQEVVVVGYGHKPDPSAEGEPTKLEVFQIDHLGVVTKIASIDAPPEAIQVQISDVIGNDPNDGYDNDVEEIVVLLHTGMVQVYPIVQGEIGEPIETEIRPGATAFDLSDRIAPGGQLLDFNRDGRVDLAVAHVGGRPRAEGDPLSNGFVELFTGTGDGRFALVSTFDDVSTPSDLVIDDLTGDGIAEVAITNLYSQADISQDPPVFTFPSSVTIMQLQFSAREITLTDGAVTTANFAFQQADPELLLDSNGDGNVTPLDALRVINEIARNQTLEAEQNRTGRAATDVNGDGKTSALDALLIINHLHEQRFSASGQLLIEFESIDDDDEEDELAAIDLVLTQGLELE